MSQNEWWKKSWKAKDHQGRWDRDTVLNALSKTKMNPRNKARVVKFLCDGVGLSDFDCSRQQVYDRVKIIIRKLVEENK